jgi:hypothetical protein
VSVALPHPQVARFLPARLDRVLRPGLAARALIGRVPGWIGEDFDPDGFDADFVETGLRRIRV